MKNGQEKRSCVDFQKIKGVTAEIMEKTGSERWRGAPKEGMKEREGMRVRRATIDRSKKSTEEGRRVGGEMIDGEGDGG